MRYALRMSMKEHSVGLHARIQAGEVARHEVSADHDGLAACRGRGVRHTDGRSVVRARHWCGAVAQPGPFESVVELMVIMD